MKDIVMRIKRRKHTHPIQSFIQFEAQAADGKRQVEIKQLLNRNQTIAKYLENQTIFEFLKSLKIVQNNQLVSPRHKKKLNPKFVIPYKYFMLMFTTLLLIENNIVLIINTNKRSPKLVPSAAPDFKSNSHHCTTFQFDLNCCTVVQIPAKL